MVWDDFIKRVMFQQISKSRAESRPANIFQNSSQDNSSKYISPESRRFHGVLQWQQRDQCRYSRESEEGVGWNHKCWGSENMGFDRSFLWERLKAWRGFWIEDWHDLLDFQKMHSNVHFENKPKRAKHWIREKPVRSIISKRWGKRWREAEGFFFFNALCGKKTRRWLHFKNVELRK